MMAYGGWKNKRFQGRDQLPMLLDDQGEVISSREKAASAKLHYFADVEKAQITSIDEMRQHYNQYPNTAAVHTELELEFIPSLFEIERGIRKAKKHRASGIDNIKDDVMQICPEQSARLFHPVIAKTAFRAQRQQSSRCTQSQRQWRPAHTLQRGADVQHGHQTLLQIYQKRRRTVVG